MSTENWFWICVAAFFIWVAIDAKKPAQRPTWAPPSTQAPHSTPSAYPAIPRTNWEPPPAPLYVPPYAPPLGSRNSLDVEFAKQNFESAADDLRRAVRGLDGSPWPDQMDTVRRRLGDADDALSQLEALRPGDISVMNARSEVDQMRSTMSRLHSDNWRDVVPTIDRNSRAIENEAAGLILNDD
jgi:hypothetical protein